jgi:hypothetical protein
MNTSLPEENTGHCEWNLGTQNGCGHYDNEQKFVSCPKNTESFNYCLLITNGAGQASLPPRHGGWVGGKKLT